MSCKLGRTHVLLWCMGGLVEVEQQEQLQVQLLGHGQGLQWSTPWALLQVLVLGHG